MDEITGSSGPCSTARTRSCSARQPTWARPPAPSTPSPRRPPRAFPPQAWKDKLAAGFTNSGSKSGDKLHTLQFFQILAAQLGMHWVNLGLLPGWNSSAASDHDLNRLGVSLGAAAQTDIDEGPEHVHKSDVATAEHLGQRVAETAKILLADRAQVA
ncbi:hypothetical protein [Nocardioides sp. NPDC006273]|uniref:hypothetical protein n=1 Tax=Nocardioides sp. NPDC006273 TaxID=3155598 RepID=UPI0033B0C961